MLMEFGLLGGAEPNKLLLLLLLSGAAGLLGDATPKRLGFVCVPLGFEGEAGPKMFVVF